MVVVFTLFWQNLNLGLGLGLGLGLYLAPGRGLHFFGKILIFVLNMRLFCQGEEYQGEGLQHGLHQVTV